MQRDEDRELVGNQRDKPTGSELRYSRPFDVHVWSEYLEVNLFVDSVFKKYFEGGKPKKKHVKLVLLDLYVAWLQDPSLFIQISLNVNSYRPKSRYNELHISKMVISVVKKLEEEGLIDLWGGFQDRKTGSSFETRIAATKKLIRLFEGAKIDINMLGSTEDRETIILRNEDYEAIDYEDTAGINRMRGVVQDYNALLNKTFVDIPTLDSQRIELGLDRLGKQSYLPVNQRDKFTRRVFNRSSFKKGGRFYGGWWQRCPKRLRQEIFINDSPTVEVDYSGLHVVLLYALKGINYWSDVGEDPYTVEEVLFINDPEHLRSTCKQLFLVSLNAKNENAAYSAFRSEAETGSVEKRYTNKQLSELLKKLKYKHSRIAEALANDAGIGLMNLDAQITEEIIQHFVDHEVPVLSVHDSYIIPIEFEGELKRAMQDAISSIGGLKGAKLSHENHEPANWEPLDLEDAMGFDFGVWDKAMIARYDPIRTHRYGEQLAQFRRRELHQGPKARRL